MKKSVPSWRAGARSAQRSARRHGRQLRRRLPGSTLAVARRLPMPVPVRQALSTTMLWRPGLHTVPLDAILLGGQNGMSATEFAEAIGDHLWPSRRVVDGPHAELLRAAHAAPLSDEQILTSSYGDLARAGIATSGQYFGARDDQGIVDQARQFLAWDAEAATTSGAERPHASKDGSPVLLAPIRDSDCYQVVDGHHRLAALAAAGAVVVRARVRRVPASTPLQDVLDEMSWIGGERELYQPVVSPELERSWTIVRRCTDRLERMDKVLDDLGLAKTARARLEGAADVEAPTYLDVASCYGWFLAQLKERGFAVQGVERDGLGAFLGSMVYGLDADHVHTGQAQDFLRGLDPQAFDVVSCFSLLHHIVRDEGPAGGAEFVRLLDRATARVLFLDTGQAHEAWFRDVLPEWDTDHVRDFLREHTTFDDIIDLGPDDDAVGAYADNYGRHLFACVRW